MPAERIASSDWSRGDIHTSGRVPAEARKLEISVDLRPISDGDEDMVAVPGGEFWFPDAAAPTRDTVVLDAYLLDRFEVTNSQYRDFVLTGGYRADSLWAQVPSGVRARMRDRTGLPGPRDWVSQDHPEGQGHHPVTGVTWYEARAYCIAQGKRLPTVFEWSRAAREDRFFVFGMVFPWGIADPAEAATRANFNADGSSPVDAFPFGISPHGAHGMAGNALEWTANPYGDGYAVTGGGWDGPSYLFSQLSSRPPDDRARALGFRCARSEGSGSQGLEPLPGDTRAPNFEPVDAATFQGLLEHYRYDRIPPSPRVVSRDEAAGWTRERIWIDGPDADSVLLYFYVPKSASPPYQTIVYAPTGGAQCCITVAEEVEWAIAPAIQAGRAVLAPVLARMVERWPDSDPGPPDPTSVRYRDLMVRLVTELRLSLDYAVGREDVNDEALAYVGMSASHYKVIFPAVEDRIGAVALVGAGWPPLGELPEADPIHFAPRIGAPVLLLNGRRDEITPWLTEGLPLWEALPEPKELVLVEGAGHIVSLEQRVTALNEFLDRTLGPVR